MDERIIKRLKKKNEGWVGSTQETFYKKHFHLFSGLYTQVLIIFPVTIAEDDRENLERRWEQPVNYKV